MSQRSKNIEINLLSERKHRLKRRRALLGRLQVVAGVVMAVYMAILLVVAGIRTAVAVQLNSVEDDIEEYERELGQLQTTETLYAVMINKFSLFDDVLENRVSTTATLQRVSDLVPEGVTFNQVSFAEGKDGVEVSYSTFSLPELIALLDVFEQVTQEDGDYDSIVVNSFSRTNDGSYDLSALLLYSRGRE